MAKPEWGTKRTCPHCGTRFYDLGKDDPVHCINCDKTFQPESVLKSKQAAPYEARKEPEKKKDAETDDDLDLDVDEDEEPSPENEVDLGGDDDLGVSGDKDDEEES